MGTAAGGSLSSLYAFNAGRWFVRTFVPHYHSHYGHHNICDEDGECNLFGCDLQFQWGDHLPIGWCFGVWNLCIRGCTTRWQFLGILTSILNMCATSLRDSSSLLCSQFWGFLFISIGFCSLLLQGVSHFGISPDCRQAASYESIYFDYFLGN